MPSFRKELLHAIQNTIELLDILCGLEVTCSPRDPSFAGSNPLRSMNFLGCKNPEHNFSGRDFKPGVLSLKFQAY